MSSVIFIGLKELLFLTGTWISHPVNEPHSSSRFQCYFFFSNKFTEEIEKAPMMAKALSSFYEIQGWVRWIQGWVNWAYNLQRRIGLQRPIKKGKNRTEVMRNGNVSWRFRDGSPHSRSGGLWWLCGWSESVSWAGIQQGVIAKPQTGLKDNIEKRQKVTWGIVKSLSTWLGSFGPNFSG